jgi:hypothetical protein
VNLPEIPLPAIRVAARASLQGDFTEGDDGFSAVLEAAWPHLYAAALRDAADALDNAEDRGYGQWASEAPGTVLRMIAMGVDGVSGFATERT